MGIRAGEKRQKPGTFAIILVVTVLSCRSVDLTEPEPINKPSQSNFSASTRTGQAPLTIQFTHTGTDAQTFSWDFGDGARSSDRNPTHTYVTAGTYDVRLVCTGAAGTDTTFRDNFINVSGPVATLNALFIGTPVSGPAPLDVQFTDQSTGYVSNHSWSFGDGGSSAVKNPTRRYTAPGQYTVRLIVSGASGSDTLTKPNYITVTSASGAPVAAFAASPLSGTRPLTVTFTDQSTGNPTSWQWTFGDGNSSSQRNPTHTYTAAGSYNVTLRVTGPGGTDTESKNAYIVVGSGNTAPVAEFGADVTSGLAPLTVKFHDKSVGHVSTRLWTFGDGSTSGQRDPSHTYTSAGNYTVSLTVGGSGGTDSEVKTGFISVTCNAPTANFTVDRTSAIVGADVRFTSTSNGPINRFSWNFGDGNTSSSENPSHEYDSPGTYTVSLTVSGDCGSDTETKTNLITIIPACSEAQVTPGTRGPFWVTASNGDCFLGTTVNVAASAILFIKNNRELWARVELKVRQNNEDRSTGELKQEFYLGYSAPAGYEIESIESESTAVWNYNDNDNNIDEKTFALCRLLVHGATDGPDICGQTLDDSHLIVEFNTIRLNICAE